MPQVLLVYSICSAILVIVFQFQLSSEIVIIVYSNLLYKKFCQKIFVFKCNHIFSIIFSLLYSIDYQLVIKSNCAQDGYF